MTPYPPPLSLKSSQTFFSLYMENNREDFNQLPLSQEGDEIYFLDFEDCKEKISALVSSISPLLTQNSLRTKGILSDRSEGP